MPTVVLTAFCLSVLSFLFSERFGRYAESRKVYDEYRAAKATCVELVHAVQGCAVYNGAWLFMMLACKLGRLVACLEFQTHNPQASGDLACCARLLS